MMQRLFILFLDFYHVYISKACGLCCRYYPTCSEYTKQAVIKYGLLKGILKGILRILRCHPFWPSSGYDPLG